MTQFKTEGQPLFENANKENENSSASSTETTKTDQTQSSAEDKSKTENANGGSEDNFADHPRWKEREEDWKNRFNEQEQRHTKTVSEAIEKVRQEFLSKTTTTTEAALEQPPSWFGGDEKQWAEFQKWDQERVKKAADQAQSSIKSDQQKEQARIDEATKFFNESVKEIETDKALNPQGLEVDRNKLLKFCLDNDIVDSKGRWNYKAAFKSMGAEAVFKAKQALQERKIIAGATTSENRGETKSENVTTSADFQKPGGRPW